MGAATSKAPKRAFPKTPSLQRAGTPSGETAARAVPSSATQTDDQQQQQQHAHEKAEEQDFLKQLKQEGVKDAELGSFLDKLGGAIGGKHVSTTDVKHGNAKHVVHQRKEEGRLGTAELQRLFQDVHRMEQSQKQLDLGSLSHRYDIDKSLLEKVIHFNRVPAVTQQADGSLFGSWEWKS